MVASVVAVAALIPAVALSASGGFHVRLISQNSHGVRGNDESSTEGAALVSHDGRVVAFNSTATNLPGANASISEVYVRTTGDRRTHLISTKNNGAAADGGVGSPAISANGRFVVFSGDGDGLPGATPPDDQVWIHDRKMGRTRLVSRAMGGAPGDGGSGNPFVSASGRYVAFESTSTNLPGGDGVNNFEYMRDTKKRRTVLVSRTSSGAPVPASSYGQLISNGGRLVVFQSADAALPGGDGSTEHAYMRDLKHHRTILIDRTASGDVGSGDARGASISGGGRFVAFQSEAANMPGGDGSTGQVYLRDLKTKVVTLVSQDNAGTPSEGAGEGRVSLDGRRVAFDSDSANLPGGDGTNYQTYMRNIATGKTRLLSSPGNGSAGDDDSFYPSISSDGRWVSFDSYAGNLGGTPTDSNLFLAGPIG